MGLKRGKVMGWIGFFGLMHAALSAAQHRSYLRLIEQEFTYLPIDIILQTIISLLLAMWGILCISGDFKEVRAAKELESKTFDTFGNTPSFYIFNHRGQRLTQYITVS